MQKDNSLFGRIGRLRSEAPSYREFLRVWRHTIGAVSVEFALVAPVLLILILIAFDFGVGMYEQQVLANAARAGAQYAVLSTTNAQDEGEIQTAVANAAQKDAADLDTSSEVFCQCQSGTGVSCTKTCDGDAPEVYVRITVKFKHETLLSYPTLDNPITLIATSEFRLR